MTRGFDLDQAVGVLERTPRALHAWLDGDAQIARVMAKRYREDIGPWLAYLPVVTDRPVPASDDPTPGRADDDA